MGGNVFGCRGANYRPLRGGGVRGMSMLPYPTQLIGPWEYLQQCSPPSALPLSFFVSQPRTALLCTRPLYICTYICGCFGIYILGFLFLLLDLIYHHYLPCCVSCLLFLYIPQILYISYPLLSNYPSSSAFPRIYTRNGLHT